MRKYCPCFMDTVLTLFSHGFVSAWEISRWVADKQRITKNCTKNKANYQLRLDFTKTRFMGE